MAAVLKRSDTTGIPHECAYGCCTVIYGRHVKSVRRKLKRRERRTWEREVRLSM